MKIFKAEQWNLDLLLPLFEEYRITQGMTENPDRTLAFLNNRIRFSESIIFLAVNNRQRALGFIQLYPRLSSLRLQRYWQVTDIFVSRGHEQSEIDSALLEKAKEFVRFTRSDRLIIEQNHQANEQWERRGFKLNTQKSVFELRL